MAYECSAKFQKILIQSPAESLFKWDRRHAIIISKRAKDEKIYGDVSNLTKYINIVYIVYSTSASTAESILPCSHVYFSFVCIKT